MPDHLLKVVPGNKGGGISLQPLFSLSLSLIFSPGTPVFLLDFKRDMHRDEQRRCLHIDETLVLLTKMT